MLLPRRCKVILLADRGFADTDLMAHLQQLGWHWRIRIKTSFWLYRPGRPRCKVERLAVAQGQAYSPPLMRFIAWRQRPEVQRSRGGSLGSIPPTPFWWEEISSLAG